MADKETRNYWSGGGQIYFCGGSAYGLDDNLQTFCMGNEADILKVLKEKTKTDNPVINKILREELNEAGKTKNGATAIPRRRRMQFGGLRDRG